MRSYINLTNGIEFLGLPEYSSIEFKFIRIQSTWLEQHRYDDLIRDLDYGFLIDGVTKGVRVYDTSSKKKVPRSLYQGMPFIKYTIDTLLGFNPSNPIVKRINVRRYFDEQVAMLSTYSKKKILYLDRVLTPKPFKYEIVARSTDLDGDYDAYKEILNAYQDKEWEEKQLEHTV